MSPNVQFDAAAVVEHCLEETRPIGATSPFHLQPMDRQIVTSLCANLTIKSTMLLY